MKFAEKLTAHLTPEWRKQYIDYDELKEFLYKSIQDIDRTEDWTEEIITHLDQCDVEFFEKCQNALHKIDVFFNEKLAEATRKFANLSEELEDFLESESSKTTNFFAGSKLSLSWRHHDSTRRRSSEQTDPKSKENGAVRVKLNSVELDEKQDFEDGLRHRRSRLSSTVERKKTPKPSKKEKKTFRKLHDLKLAFSEFYLSLVLLQNYQTLNFTGFRKILKKHDKLFRRDNGLLWRQQNVEPANFNTSREVDDLITKVENEYTEKLEQGDRGRAMKRLRVPPLSERHNPRAVFRFGFFAGIFLVQSVIIILTCIFLRPLPKYYLPALRIFRTTFLIIFFLCLFGLNTYGWRSSGVNNVLIFELNPRSHLDHFQLLEASFFLATIWGCAVIYFLFSAVLNIPSYVSPFVLVLFMILCLLNPFKFGYYRARRWLLRILWRIFRAPFCRVTFPDFWLADQLNSLSFILPELATFICFYSSQINWRDGMKYLPLINPENLTEVAQSTLPRCAFNADRFLGDSCQCNGVLFGIEPILRTLPAWFRFAQCLRRYRDMDVKKINPHIVNAGKYSTSFFVTATTIWLHFAPSVPALVFMVLSYLANSTYTYSWDILMDWGLMECHSDNKLLRDELVYRYKAYYYVAIVEDFILRFTWIIRLAVQQVRKDQLELVVTILTAAEVVRRFIWNFFRLENEHLNNCGEFRAVRDIFITPLPKRPSRTVSAQLFSTVYGPQHKNNLVYPINNSALHLAHLHHQSQPNNSKSKQAYQWALPTMTATNVQCANLNTTGSPKHEWNAGFGSPTERSKAQSLLNRISAVTLKRLPRRMPNRRNHRAVNHHAHHRYHHHIMDNIELAEKLRTTLNRNALSEEAARHPSDEGTLALDQMTQLERTDMENENSNVRHTTQQMRITEDNCAPTAIRIVREFSSSNPDKSDQLDSGNDTVLIQRLRCSPTAHLTPALCVSRSRSDNDLESCARTRTYALAQDTGDSSCETMSSIDPDIVLLHPTDTAVTLLSQDQERDEESANSMHAYNLLVPTVRQRPRFVATSSSSLESPEVENPPPLHSMRSRRPSVNRSLVVDAAQGSCHPLEVIQNERLSLEPVYPRIIQIDQNISPTDHKHEKTP